MAKCVKEEPVTQTQLLVKPELLATASNQIWSGYQAKLQALTRVDLFLSVCHSISLAVTWLLMVAHREQAGVLAQRVIADSCQNKLSPEQIHADRGSSMTSRPVAFSSDPGITKPFSSLRQ